MDRAQVGTAIEFLCVAAHEVRDQSAVTVHEGRWAYCASGGNGEHTWEAILPTPLAELQRRRHLERASKGAVAVLLPKSIPNPADDGQVNAAPNAHAAPTVAVGGSHTGSVGARSKRTR